MDITNFVRNDNLRAAEHKSLEAALDQTTL